MYRPIAASSFAWDQCRRHHRDGRDIYGCGINVTARLEALAEPGRIFVSGVVHDRVRDKLDVASKGTGEQQVKNIARPVAGLPDQA
jgi:class 3 adenylate cyclase